MRSLRSITVPAALALFFTTAALAGPTDPPARSTIQVGLAGGWKVEIEAIAVRR